MKDKKWILKPGQESFEVVDGDFAGRKFVSGKVYSEIPEQEKKRFASWAPKSGKTKTAPKTTENKK